MTTYMDTGAIAEGYKGLFLLSSPQPSRQPLLRCSTFCIRAATVLKIKLFLRNQGSIRSLFSSWNLG